MKLHADKLDTQSITAYGEDWIAVNGRRHTHSLVLAPSGQLIDWSCTRFENLTTAHFSMLVGVMPEAPELVIFGSGSRLRFPRPVLLSSLIDQRIGVETMDTAAACRTYNILASEGRRVVAALLIET
ncbi:MAG: Mth938-like domain-containing protein [Gallionella sp.]|nr:Mth938-like domain-containing protein [Hydrogenophaga sp.]MDZ4200715.1 Mth938-like domain-containing protein [Gallionella sp.]